MRWTVDPARPFHVGPVDLLPLTEWQPVQLYFSAAFLPAAIAAGVTGTVNVPPPPPVELALSFSTPRSSPFEWALVATVIVVLPAFTAVNVAPASACVRWTPLEQATMQRRARILVPWRSCTPVTRPLRPE